MNFKIIKFIILLSFIFLVQACNKNLTEEEKKELWSKAQTTGEIINRSGTKFSSGRNKKLALSDAETRLQSGGGLFGKKGLDASNLIGNNQSENVSIGMPINPYFWKASLETISFMPLISADPFGGIIITDWHSIINSDERCKLNIFIKGMEMKTANLKVNSFCQKLINNNWIDQQINEENNIKIENAILNKAKKLRLSQG
jgi:hypothetical protein